MATRNSTAEAAADLLSVEDRVDILWVLLCTFLVLSMQFGFAMLEVGSCRRAHRMTVLAKNTLDSTISCLAFWAYCHWGSTPTLVANDSGTIANHLLLFHWAFCATAVTICSGAMAERTHMFAYICYSIVMAGMIYPRVACAAWGDSSSLLSGEFQERFHEGYRYHDFAGSGVVHLTGGCAAFVGSALVGRRILRAEPEKDSLEDPRWDPFEEMDEDLRRGTVAEEHRKPQVPEQKQEAQPQARQLRELSPWQQEQALRLLQLPRQPVRMPSKSENHKPQEEPSFQKPKGGWPRRFDSCERDAQEFVGCHYMQAMGMFILWVGWYGFNSGSTLTMDPAGCYAAGLVAWNTTLAASAGGVGCCIHCYCFRRDLDVGSICNGVLSGLVAITAACDVATERISLLIGLTAGLLVYPWSECLLNRMKMDDPVGAIPVHGFCGLFGVLCAGLCLPDCDRLARVGGGLVEQARFCAEGHDVLLQLVAQAWGAFTEMWWTCSCSLVLWGIFAVSEIAHSLEAIYFEEAERLLTELEQRACADLHAQAPPVADCVQLAAHACAGSPVVRRLMKEYGWDGADFPPSVDFEGLRRKLRQFHERKLDTALEVDGWPPLRGMARLLRHLCLVRYLTLVRLRISPGAELSGLGHANADGGQLFKALQMAMSIHEETSESTVQLERQVRELAQIVRSQDTVLQVVAGPDKVGSSSWRAAPHPLDIYSAGHDSGGSARTRSTWSGGGSSSRSPGSRGDATPISFRSGSLGLPIDERVPRPAMLGRPTGRGGDPAALAALTALGYIRPDAPGLQELAGEVARSLQAQQELLANLGLMLPSGTRSPASNSVVSGSYT